MNIYHCIDCGRQLRTPAEERRDVCNICHNSTHVEYRSNLDNAVAAWKANKERHRKTKAIEESIETSIEVIRPTIRKFKIK